MLAAMRQPDICVHVQMACAAAAVGVALLLAPVNTPLDCDCAHILHTLFHPWHVQVIDVKSQRLQNVITFPPDGAFIVDSSIAVESAQRVSFKFTAAKLKTASKDWGVPPFGQGW